MRISDDRYSRDLRRHNLALRMVGHEARTQTICDWTGLSDERIRALCQSYPGGSGSGHATRHRGPSPRRLAFFLRSSRMRDESAALGGLCALLGVVPTKPLSNARRELPGLSRGERLCFAFEFYRHLVPASEVTLEHFVLLATALAQGTEVEMVPCVHCGGIMVVERHPAARRGCDYCSRSRGSYTMGQPPVGERSVGPDARNPQGTLF